jgi:hypothetical protein
MGQGLQKFNHAQRPVDRDEITVFQEGQVLLLEKRQSWGGISATQ